MIRIDEIDTLLTSGGAVVGPDGERIGTVKQVFLDERTGTPEWATVATGLFGTSETFVPLGGGTVRGDHVVVPYDRSAVKDAPRTNSAEGHLSEAEEALLYRHYGLDHHSHHAGARALGDAPGATTGSAERSPAGTVRSGSGTAYLRKYVAPGNRR
ncbi:PRC-barrel domain-containing protein [Cellulomonas aerilata]|uniref:PRC-barrel domain-containing protein n=1 Tax=Cellulomonas aerilata TaxID=515326 RepID=A0A512DA09_9CELL|nr:PRC-barrel domain-containing protein [Cellulomonas aerilata]GEO33309.1 hypothetical protein CAE01nite_10340 [Cellulomonas aerilata]